jgi:hypothetical protein
VNATPDHDPETGEIIAPTSPPNPYAVRDVPAILRILEDGGFLARLDAELAKILEAMSTSFAKDKMMTAGMTIKLEFIPQPDVEMVKMTGDVSTRLPAIPKSKSALFLSTDGTHFSRVHPRQLDLGLRPVGGAGPVRPAVADGPIAIRSAPAQGQEVRPSA